MSNSPDDPLLIPGHPEFVQRPATWEKTVAKQIIKISKAEETPRTLALRFPIMSELQSGVRYVVDADHFAQQERELAAARAEEKQP